MPEENGDGAYNTLHGSNTPIKSMKWNDGMNQILCDLLPHLGFPKVFWDFI